MRFKKIGILILLALLASSCGAPATTPPPIVLEDLQSTTMARAFTAMAETYEALPNNTRVPPGETPTETPIPSKTLEAFATPSSSSSVSPTPTALLTKSPTPSPTKSPTRLATKSPTQSSTRIPTVTLQPTALGSDPCNKPLTSWQGPSTKIMIRYEYKPQGKNDKVVLSLWVMSDLKECGFISSLSTGPVGQYSAVAFIDGEKDFKVSGGFRLTEGSWEIIIRNDVIVAKGGCYPNC